MKKIKKLTIKNITLFLIIIIGILFFVKNLIFLDPDFGWHIRLGEIILKNGLPQTDPFSYTMPSYHIIDHEWLSEVLMVLIYKSIGIIGLAIIFSLIPLISLILLIPKEKIQLSFVPLSLSMTTIIGISGIRVQLITWLFLTVFLKILISEKYWNKLKYSLPFLMIIWVNLHGGFAIGIFVIGIKVFLDLIKKTLKVSAVIIFFLTLLATVINPYGAKIWYEVWITITNPLLKSYIVEWLPKIYYPDTGFIVLVSLSLFLLRKYFKKLSPLVIIYYIIFLISGLLTQRNTPFWIIISTLLTVETFYIFNEECKKDIHIYDRMKKVYILLNIVALLIFFNGAWNGIKNAISYSENNEYPVHAITYLKRHPIKGNIFTLYKWGGYISWKLPEKKVFINGLMPTWQNKNAPNSQSKNAFQDYINLMYHNKDPKYILEKYDIQEVLLDKNTTGLKNNILTTIEISILNSLNLINRENNNFQSDLIEQGWKLIYQDKNTVIYESPNLFKNT